MKRNTLLFILSQSVGLCAENVFTLGIALVVWHHTGSALDVGLVWSMIYGGSFCAFFAIPRFKKYAHKKVIQSSDIVSALCLLAITLIHSLNLHVYLILPLLGLYGLLRTINKGFVQGFIAYIAPNDHALPALHTDYQIASITASAIALIILFTCNIVKHVDSIMLLASAGFLLCFCFTCFLKIYKPFAAKPARYRQLLQQSWHDLVHHRTIFALIILCSCVFALGVSLNNQLYPLMTLYHFSFRHYIGAEVCMTIALLLTGIILRKLSNLMTRTGYEKVFITGWIITGTCYMALPFVAFSFVLFVILLTLSAIADSTSSVAQRLLLNQKCHHEVVENIFTMRIIARDIYKIIIAALLGLSIQYLGAGTSLVMLGTCMIVMMVSVAIIILPHTSNIKNKPSP